MAPTPFVRDVPAAEALKTWYGACANASCPERLEPVRGIVPATGGGTMPWWP